MLARHMYIFEAKYIPIIATLKHKAVDMERQCGHLIKILLTYASVLFFQNMFLRLFRFIEN